MYALPPRAAVACLALLAAAPSHARGPSPAPSEPEGEYRIVVEGYDWGAAVSRVILSLDETVTSADANDYTVAVTRHTECVALPPEQASGDRRVGHAYVSDPNGAFVAEGRHVTLVLGVAPHSVLGAPLQYVVNDKCRGNVWVDYDFSVTDTERGRVWNRKTGRISPLVDRFDLSGKFVHEDGTALTYASYAPDTAREKSPLLIWLHGGGEGGTDPSIPLLANRAANYASDEIQVLFDGAYVLVPQTPGAWMHNRKGEMTRGAEDDVYNAALIALIREYVATHPGVDPDRVFLGGCSNGGYMTLKLMLLHPDDFAAGFISSLAYGSEFISDEQIRSIAHLPIWFVHSADDTTTRPEQTVLPVYERLKAAGAQGVYLSYYDHVVDITGFFGGKDYRYPGHWSWIYLHANLCRRDRDGNPVRLDGRPVTIMEWLAAQTKANRMAQP
jgi:predicted esterase